ncbi:MAG: SDR family oxidoreductase [Spartobacteria bacterium]|nr:SDR family oxidoreductase [Spartobacteria bacterium]
MQLKGCYALVTGGGQRLGAAFACHLARQGVHTLIHCHRSVQSAEKTAAQCREYGVSSYVLQADLMQSDAVEELMTQAMAVAGRIDILLCNAATFHADRIQTLQANQMLEQWQVNFMAPMLCTKAFARDQRCGKIIYLLDQRITRTDRQHVSYAISKKLLAEMVTLSAIELAPGITVNGIAPGPVWPPARKMHEAVREFAGFIPLEKRPTVAQLLMALDYLMQNDAVTGQILYVDGGQHCEGKANG